MTDNPVLDEPCDGLWQGDFLRLFLGFTLSAVGDRLAFVVLPFLILAADSPVWAVAWVLGARSVGFAASVLAGGVVADRMGPQRMLMFSEGVRALVQAAVVLVCLQTTLSVVSLIVLSALYGLAEGVAVPSAKALLPQVVAKPHLERANGYLSVAYTSGHLLGPMLAGVLVAAQLGVVAIALDGLSFLLCALLVASLRLPVPTRHVIPVTAVAQFVEGVQLLRTRRSLMWMLFAGVTLHLTTLPAVYALGPAWAQTHLGGAAAWGVLVSAFGIGGVIGGLVAAHVRPHRPALWFFLSLIPVAAQPLMLVWTPVFWWVAALQGLAGFSLALLNVMEDLSLQHGVPPTLIARVASLLMFASTVALPLGYAVVAGMASTLGVQMAMTVLGVACVLIAIVGVTLPGVRTLTVARSDDAVRRH